MNEDRQYTMPLHGYRYTQAFYAPCNTKMSTSFPAELQVDSQPKSTGFVWRSAAAGAVPD